MNATCVQEQGQRNRLWTDRRTNGQTNGFANGLSLSLAFDWGLSTHSKLYVFQAYSRRSFVTGFDKAFWTLMQISLTLIHSH